MKSYLILTAAACGGMFLTANIANAQEVVEVAQETVSIVTPVECKTHYTTNWRDNWYLQLGAGIQSPFVENDQGHRRITAMYNVGVGRWFSPYIGFRFAANYGAIHWNQGGTSRAKVANLNLDFMWDICNSICGPNEKRPVSVVPYVGLGGNLTWDMVDPKGNIHARGMNRLRHTQWTTPVSTGLQIRFRLSDYMDFFVEGRAMFMGDNYNNCAEARPLDIDLTAIGGFAYTFGGRHFETYNPCDYVGYINNLNEQVNNLRGELAATTAALALAQSQTPAPAEVNEVTVLENGAVPMLAAVRFTINSAEITDEEMVNVYNVAQWLKANPEAAVTVQGYADRDTGTSEYNQELSARRANAVIEALTGKYGIDGARLTQAAYGSSTQPYPENNWNRIVIFTQQ